jgi:hypothetical protein
MEAETEEMEEGKGGALSAERIRGCTRVCAEEAETRMRVKM